MDLYKKLDAQRRAMDERKSEERTRVEASFRHALIAAREAGRKWPEENQDNPRLFEILTELRQLQYKPDRHAINNIIVPRPRMRDESDARRFHKLVPGLNFSGEFLQAFLDGIVSVLEEYESTVNYRVDAGRNERGSVT